MPTNPNKKLYDQRGAWRDQIYKDAELSHATFRVGYGLAEHMTKSDTANTFFDTGRIEVFPSHALLSRDAHVSLDTVRVSIAQLEERGHLKKVRRGNSWTGSNLYRIIVKKEKGCAMDKGVHRGNSGEQTRKFRDKTP